MVVPVLLFIVGLLLLIWGGSWFVDGAVAFARRFHFSELLIGATVVSIGTTLPEVVVSATSAIVGHGEIAYGNAIGSVICNTALIAAISIVVMPTLVEQKTIRIPLLFFFGSALFMAAISYTTGFFSRTTGILLLLIFAGYLIGNGWGMKRYPVENSGEQGTQPPSLSLSKTLCYLVAGCALIVGGAQLLVDNGILIAEGFRVPESVIALTFVALGTSLPELTTAISALIKGHSTLSLGNVIGANVCNLVLVCGVSITISPFGIPERLISWGYNVSLLLDFPVLFLVMLILSLPALFKGKLYRAQGVVLLLIYAGFCALQFVI